MAGKFIPIPMKCGDRMQSIAGNGIFLVLTASDRFPQWQKYKVLEPIRQKDRPAETLFDDVEQYRDMSHFPFKKERTAMKKRRTERSGRSVLPKEK
jgi:hypothetical protein